MSVGVYADTLGHFIGTRRLQIVRIDAGRRDPSACMRIVHVSPLYAPAVGGAELHLRELSERLVARGHRVSVLTADARSVRELGQGRRAGLPSVESLRGVAVIRLPPGAGYGSRVLRRWQGLRGGHRTSRFLLGTLLGRDGVDMMTRRAVLTHMVWHILGVRADIVTSMNWFWPPAYQVHLARGLRRFALVGIPLFHTAEAWAGAPMYRRMLRRCDGVIANTAHEAQFARERGARRVVVGGVGVDPHAFVGGAGEQVRHRYGLGQCPVVGFVGRQTAKKGVVSLIEAMRWVWEWNRESRLVLAGPLAADGEVTACMDSLEPWQRSRVVRIGEFDESDKASIYDAFDVFALPSTEESFGIAYLEAWLCRKPVIGSRIGPTQCVIDERVDGLLVDPRRSRDLARAIIELLSDPDKRVSMGSSGWKKTVENHTWDKVVDRVEDFYRHVARRDAAPW